MADLTNYYNLIKPAQDDFYNVDEFNQNMDIIDAALRLANTYALPLVNEGIMKKDLVIQKTSPYIDLYNTTTGRTGRIHNNNSKEVVLANRTDDKNLLELVMKSETDAAKTLLSLRSRKNNKLTTHQIFGDHNKPHGAYAGISRDLSFDRRTIDTGGVGNLLIVFGDCSTLETSSAAQQWLSIVTPYGAIIGRYADSGVDTLLTDKVTMVSDYTAKYSNGVLTFMANGTVVPYNAFNRQGIVYYYYCI